jgi:hypothetical protein
MKTWALLSFTACGISLLLCGCGGGSTPAVVSPLAGNWLLVGPMPTNEISITVPPASSTPSTPPAPSGVRLAMTFDVTGRQVIAGGFGSNFCDNVQAGFEFGDVAAGILTADDSFTATPANSPLNTVSIKGTAPQKSGEPWSGSYAVSLGGAFAPACDANLSGTFTAISFPLVSGVYVGTGSTLAGQNGFPKAVPVTLQVTLQQGGMVTNPGNGAASNYFSNALLTGSIKVQGSPCFSSGATRSTPASSVIGNMVSARFLMDDGSALSLEGPLTDVTEGHISTGIILVQGGNCGGTNPTSAFVVTGLDRQS